MNVVINSQSPVAMYRQIVDQVIQNLAAGQLAPGDQLPSIRSLSTELRINPNTVIKAYRELELRGYAESRHGKGFFAADGSAKQARDDWRVRARDEIRDAVTRAVKLGMKSTEIMDIVEAIISEGGSK